MHVKKWTSFLLLVKKLLTETFDSIQTVHSNVRFPNITTALLFHSNKILRINQRYLFSFIVFVFVYATNKRERERKDMRLNRDRNTDRITQAFFRSFFYHGFLVWKHVKNFDLLLNTIKNDSISFQHNSAKMTLANSANSD